MKLAPATTVNVVKKSIEIVIDTGDVTIGMIGQLFKIIKTILIWMH